MYRMQSARAPINEAEHPRRLSANFGDVITKSPSLPKRHNEKYSASNCMRVLLGKMIWMQEVTLTNANRLQQPRVILH